MSKRFLPAAAIALLLSVGPTAACDPEEMINELRSQCRDGIAAAVALIEPIKGSLTTADRTAIEGRIRQATDLCNQDKYADGYSLTAKLARFIGHVEAQKGIAPSL